MQAIQNMFKPNDGDQAGGRSRKRRRGRKCKGGEGEVTQAQMGGGRRRRKSRKSRRGSRKHTRRHRR